MVLTICFWILWLLWIIGFFVPSSPLVSRGHGVIGAILIGILGYRLFGSPLDR